MKRLVMGFLLGLTALTPVAAQAQEHRSRGDATAQRPDRAANSTERQQRRAERLERRQQRVGENSAEDRSRDLDRPRRVRPAEPRVDRRADRPDRFDRQDQPAPELQRRPDMRGNARDRLLGGERVRQDRRDDRRGDWRQDRRDFRQDRREDRREVRNDRRDWRADRRDDRQDFRRDRIQDRNFYRSGQVWNRGWRGDDRYDWSRYRDRNRNAYRLPRYYAPGGYGYSYRRFGVGGTIGRSLFSENYWIDDPFGYRLPPAYGPYRWVRYFDDALLVDLRSGRVIDVVHDIFY